MVHCMHDIAISTKYWYYTDIYVYITEVYTLERFLKLGKVLSVKRMQFCMLFILYFPPRSNKTTEVTEYNAVYNRGVTKAPTITVYHV